MASEEDAERIAGQMALTASQHEVQVAQTLFRMQLVAGWQIPPCATVLEIGCGQGDMTAVLADAVGRGGRVTAVDRAAPDYGAPLTLGQSTDHLKETPLGQRIDFHFQYDVLDHVHMFPADAFDFVVLAHCSWYFESVDQLRRTLLRVRPWARHLCFSEWDMEPRAFDQVAHLLSVLLQGQIGAHTVGSTRNVRTPFSRTTLMRLLQETGWVPSGETVPDTAGLQDAKWEIDDCLNSCAEAAGMSGLSPKAREFLDSQIDTLRLVAARGENRPLLSYAIRAQRSPESEPA